MQQVKDSKFRVWEGFFYSRCGGGPSVFFGVEVVGLLGPGDVERPAADFLAIERVEGILSVFFIEVVDECVEAL